MKDFKQNSVDYGKVVVQKPWGYEYLMYENGTVGIWFLHLKQNARTSMHCHPHKKTGLIVLSGEAKLSFLNDSTILKPLNKMMIREGLFHCTTAVSDGGITMIEVETPCDKEDLVRMDDEYGREEKPYEGKDAFSPITEKHERLSHPAEGKRTEHRVGECVMFAEKIKDISKLCARPAGEVIVVLEGGLKSKSGEPVLSAGDVVSSDTLHRLAERFHCPDGATILSLRKII